jgi:putative addiction module component (TIGR02574 family)
MSSVGLKIPPEFDSASPHDKIAFVQALWDLIAESPDEIPIPDAHRQILDQRLKEYEDNPSGGRPWNEVRDELLAKLKSR